MSQLSICEFYRKKSVFITGGTGFLGKVIIEKLLRSCPGLDVIYFLVRPKRGKSVEERFEEFKNHEVFHRVKCRIHKLVPLTGEVGDERLGLSATDQQIVKDNVEIVFHVAATVKFNEKLGHTSKLNVLGTQQVMELCTEIKNLKTVVHVSTAYCNINNGPIAEKVYKLEEPIGKDEFLKLIQSNNEEELTEIGEKIERFFPNNYTFTKSIGEEVVESYSWRFPTAIVRPSVVTNAYQEPMPGWVEGFHGATGFICEIGRGALKVFRADPENKCDFIPVDIVANMCIAAGWSCAKNQTSKVYHCTSDQLNPLIFKRKKELIEKWSRFFPSKHSLSYPRLFLQPNLILFWILHIVLDLSLAVFSDFLIVISGGKPIMLKLARKVQQSIEAVNFFSLNGWNFDSKNAQELINEVANDKDGRKFNCAIETVDWDYYCRVVIQGIRQFILKDCNSSIKNAKLKLNILLWAEKSLIIGLIAAFIRFIAYDSYKSVLLFVITCFRKILNMAYTF